MADLPTRARVVIVGGGVIGTSVAYHLTKLGWTDVLLLEQGSLSCGTTWHAAGLVGPLRASESGTRLVQYSAELYAALEAETGLATGTATSAASIVARTEDRMVQLRRTAANAAAYDLPCELISPERAQELWPPMRVDDLLGAIWLPGDGKVNPTDLTQSLAQGRPAARRTDRGAGPGDRLLDGGRPGDRRTHRPGRRRGRGGRELRRAVGEGARRPGRRHRAAALGRALLRRHRGRRGHAPGSADHARPGRLDVLQGGGRRPGGRRLRAGGEAVALAGRPAVPVRVPAAARRTGTTSRC